MIKNILLIPITTIVILSSAVTGLFYYGKTSSTKKKPHLNEAQIAYEAYLYRQSLIKNELTGEVNDADFYNAIREAKVLNASGSRAALGLEWEEMGPDNVGGRTRAILVDKNNSSHLIAGGVSGGLWESNNGGLNWQIISSFRDITGGAYLSISCITQSGNTVYVGTGEGFNGTIPGNGVYKSTDNGATWTHLSATGLPDIITPGTGTSWTRVTDIAADPTNPDKVFATTENGGLYQSTDGGLSWNKPALITGNNAAGCVKIGNDGSLVIATIGNKNIWRSNDGGVTWSNLTTSSSLGTQANYGIATRVQIAVAPSNNNYIYLSANSASGCISGVYRSTDGGVSWSTLLGAGSTTDPMAQPGGGSGCQGWYDHCIAVVPNDETKIYIGGITLYSYSDGLSWKRSDQISSEGVRYDSPFYIHADKHTITFDPNNPEIMYIGHDGGVTKTNQANSGFPTPHFYSVDKDYRVTQFYGVAANYEGWMMAGSQDNGTQLLDYKGNTTRATTEARGGDGFACDMSRLNPNVMFASTYTSDMQRSGNKGISFGGFYDSKIDPDGNGEPGNCDGCSPFFTFGALMETKTATNSTHKSTFKNTGSSTLTSGTVINVLSNTGVTFPYTLTTNLNAGDTIQVTDIYDAKFFLATDNTEATPGCGVWVCTNPLNITQSPKWFKLPISIQMQAIDFSSNGDIAYIGCGSICYRVSGFNTATYNYTTATISGLTVSTCAIPGTSRPVGGISVDPTNSNHVVVTRTGYGTSASVHRTTDGLNFTNVNNNLPKMPVYDVVIDAANPNNYIVGTELGIWTSDNSGSSWQQETNGKLGNHMAWVPVYRLRRQPLFDEDCQVIYAGTHGRGMWRCTTLTPSSCKTTVGIKEAVAGNIEKRTLQVYPNPISDITTVDFDLNAAASVDIAVIHINGTLVSTQKLSGVVGKNTAKVDLSSFANGTYIISVKSGSNETVSKTVIKK